MISFQIWLKFEHISPVICFTAREEPHICDLALHVPVEKTANSILGRFYFNTKMDK